MKTVQTIQEVLKSLWRGSEKTSESIREQLRERYNDAVADSFSAETDAMPFSSWLSYGYRVRKGEKALKSVTFVEVLDDKGEVEKKIRRNVNLFHKNQVEKVA